MFVVAIVVGAACAAIAGILKVWRGVNEVISTIMLNYIAIGISAFLLAEPLRNDLSGNLAAETRSLPKSAHLPDLNRLFEAIGFHFPDGIVAAGVPAVRHPRRRRLLAAAQPQPLRLRPAGVGRQPGRRPRRRRQPEADGAHHDHDLRRHRRR